MENTQIKGYLDKYKIISKEMLEKHIEELSRNTYTDKDLVFMLVSVLDDEELLSNLFSRERSKGGISLEELRHVRNTFYPQVSNKKVRYGWSKPFGHLRLNYKCRAAEPDKFVIIELENPQKENKKTIEQLIKERQEYSDKLAQENYLIYETPLLKAHRLEQEKSLKRGGEITDELIKKGNRNIGSLMGETLKILIEEDLKTAEIENKTATQQIKEKQEKVYIGKLTVNVFNGDIKPVTFYNSFNTIKEVLDYLSSITYTSYTIFSGAKKIAYGTNHKQINMNRLVEEELEKQEQKVVKDWNSNSTEGVLQHWKELQNEIENNNNPFNYNFDDIKLPKQEGVKTNKNKPQLSILFTQFPKALEAIAKCSEYGHLKYKETDIDYLNYQRVEGGSKTYADAGLRHRLYKKGTTDLESQLPHAYHVAWNALAELELLIKEN